MLKASFNNTDQGWSTVDGASALENPAEGGQFGGYIRASDATAGILWYFEADARFTGDLSRYYHGTLTYFMRQESDNPTISDAVDIRIVGANGTVLTKAFDYEPGPDWTRFEVDLDAFDGWRIDNGAIARDLDIFATLLDVTSIRIRGEYQSGDDTVGLDSVRLEGGRSRPEFTVATDRGDVIASTFAAGGESWTFRGDLQDWRHVETGGAPGRGGNTGYIDLVDRAVGDLVYVEAPGAFLGQKSGYLGGTLSFSLQNSDVSPGLAPLPGVILEGGGTSLVIDIGAAPGTAWTDYSVRLAPDGAGLTDWRVGALDGPVATRADFQRVLNDLDALVIRGEFDSGPEFSGLDEVAMRAPQRPFDVYDGRDLVATKSEFQVALDAAARQGGDRIVFAPDAEASGLYVASLRRLEIVDSGMGLTGTLSFADVPAGQRFVLEIEGGGDLTVALPVAGRTSTFLAVPDGIRQTVDGNDGRDQMFANGDGSVHFSGGDNRDRLFGGPGNDRLEGKGGRDALFGGGGNDVLIGGPKADSFAFEPGNGRDLIERYQAGIDTIHLVNYPGVAARGDLTLMERANAVAILLGNGDKIVVQGVSDADDILFAFNDLGDLFAG